MSKARVIAFALAAVMVVATCWTDASATDVQGAVAALEDSFAQAVRAKDLDGIMKHYTVSENLVVFDVIPPREYTGWKAYKENWRGFLAQCKDSPKLEISDLETYGGGRFAYSHSIWHLSYTNQQDKKVDLILRVTDGYANFSGQWLIAHEHISVPVDLTTGKAFLQSQP
jgi:ketosteroid isomerase-like protein